MMMMMMMNHNNNNNKNIFSGVIAGGFREGSCNTENQETSHFDSTWATAWTTSRFAF